MMFMTGRSIVMLGAALLLSVTPALTPDYRDRAVSGLPYGLPLSGNGMRCALGNPGPKRTMPFTAAETGHL